MSNDDVSEILKGIVASFFAPNESELMPGFHLQNVYEITVRQYDLKADSQTPQNTVQVPVIRHENALELVRDAESDPYAFDLACYIAGMHMAYGGLGVLVSEPIQFLAVQALCGKVCRPPRKGRPKAKEAYKRMVQYALCRWVEAGSSLNLTRSVASKRDHLSACDAVAQAFEKAGIHTTYGQLADLCYHDTYKELRKISLKAIPTPTIRLE